MKMVVQSESHKQKSIGDQSRRASLVPASARSVEPENQDMELCPEVLALAFSREKESQDMKAFRQEQAVSP